MSVAARSGTLVLAGVLLVLGGLCARMLLGARQQVQAAQQAARQGDTAGQARHLRRAMAYYLPGNPWVSQAKKQLSHAARQAEARGQPGQALASWRELRGAILGLRGATQPFAESLAEANARIAALSAGGVGARQRQLHQRLTRPPDPHRGWTLAALAGLLIWVGGALLLFYRGLRPDARLVPARFWPLAGVVCAGLALFCLGLARA